VHSGCHTRQSLVSRPPISFKSSLDDQGIASVLQVISRRPRHSKFHVTGTSFTTPMTEPLEARSCTPSQNLSVRPCGLFSHAVSTLKSSRHTKTSLFVPAVYSATQYRRLKAFGAPRVPRWSFDHYFAASLRPVS